MLEQRFTPGVYIKELDAFPNSVVQVPTALPVFVGYTQQAQFQGKSLKKKMVKIESLSDYVSFFGTGPASTYNVNAITVTKGVPTPKTDVILNNKNYSISPVKGTQFYLYNSIQLFYLNGGGTCYIVSIGTYDNEGTSGPQLTDFYDTANNFYYTDILRTESDPTMILIPDALLLSFPDYNTLMTTALSYCVEKQSLVVLLDAWQGDTITDPLEFKAAQANQDANGNSLDPVGQLRGYINSTNLSYAAAYYPWLNSSVTSASQVNMLNIVGGFVQDFFDSPAPANSAIFAKSLTTIIGTIAGITSNANLTPDQKNKVRNAHNALLTLSPNYALLMQAVQAKINCLPAAPAVAGCIATLDAEIGVWKAPANIAISGVLSPVLKINDEMQDGMNVDAVSGKSINVIRSFVGLGVNIWGARTLDGNSQDWRYLSVRRTLIMIEQSIKLAARSYVFEANDAHTWLNLQTEIEQFLYNVWKQGGLAGTKAEQAYSVTVGLGQTMTAQDILDGYLDVAVLVAVTHPAEFIEISFQQQVQQS